VSTREEKGKLVLVRHGQTAANTEQVWHGHTDAPLTATGRQQVQRLGQHFHYYLPHIDAIYASPPKRARITAQHIAVTTGKSVILDRRLMERGIGEWEGRSFTELRDELDYSTAYCAMSTTEHPAVSHAAM
jgi:probable phosphoglycerate mutase